MSIFNQGKGVIFDIGCNNTPSTDSVIINIENDNINVLENNNLEMKLPIEGIFWNVKGIFNYKINLIKNSYAEVNIGSLLQNSNANTNVKVIAITTQNSKALDKRYENDMTFFSHNNCNAIPLGKLTVLSGTDNNKHSTVFKFWNGTPASNVSNISDAVYDVTVSIIGGY